MPVEMITQLLLQQRYGWHEQRCSIGGDESWGVQSCLQCDGLSDVGRRGGAGSTCELNACGAAANYHEAQNLPQMVFVVYKLCFFELHAIYGVQKFETKLQQ